MEFPDFSVVFLLKVLASAHVNYSTEAAPNALCQDEELHQQPLFQLNHYPALLRVAIHLSSIIGFYYVFCITTFFTNVGSRDYRYPI